jgi:hypothetical protein
LAEAGGVDVECRDRNEHLTAEKAGKVVVNLPSGLWQGATGL